MRGVGIDVAQRRADVRESDSFLNTEGKWRLTNLPPGTFEVMVDASEGNAKTKVTLAGVVARRGPMFEFFDPVGHRPGERRSIQA